MDMKLIHRYVAYLQAIICLSFFSGEISIASIPEKEMEMRVLFEQLGENLPEDNRLVTINKISEIWREILQQKATFWYPFDSLLYVGKVYSTDSIIRVYTWNIPKKDGTHDYYCFIQQVNKEREKILVYELKHDRSALSEVEDKVLNADSWYGSLYYEIIPITVKNRRYYTLLGLDLNNFLTNKKVIDILYFEEDELKLGAPLFQLGRKIQRRVIFEYSARAVMSLRYDSQRQMIIHDHLSPFQPAYSGQYQYYGPDFSFDGFIFENDRWKQVLDIEISN